MKKKFTWLAMLLFSTFVYSQSDESVHQQIDEQVWYPFIQHYEAWDVEKFQALHTKDMLRGGPWGLSSAEEYFGRNKKSWPERQAKGWTRDIAFTFEYRVLGKDMAYEVGYYRVKSVRDEGEERIYYGQFHVVLRKEEGVWKITQDWDSDQINGRELGEEDFNRNAAKGLYEK